MPFRASVPFVVLDVDIVQDSEYVAGVKLTVQVKLLPSKEQAGALLETLRTANKAANRLSQLGWDAKTVEQFPMHRSFYRQLRDEFPLSAQIVVRLISKVADAYKLDRDRQRVFRALGSISYDDRILKWFLAKSQVSIWTLGGRERIPFVCGERQRAMLAFQHGETDLVHREGKWFLFTTIDIPDVRESEAVDVLGVDFGIVEIAADSDGTKYSGSTLNKIRNRNRALRRKLQRKGTKSAKRLLKKRSRKEQRFANDTNHVISKRIVQTAQRTNRAIAIEDLTAIRLRVRARRRERTRLHSWAFAQLGGFVAYKSALAGVPLVTVDPAFTSQRCSVCGHTEKANRKSRDSFVCKSCGHVAHSDTNGAANIRLRGLEMLVGAGAFNHPHAETSVSVV